MAEHDDQMPQGAPEPAGARATSEPVQRKRPIGLAIGALVAVVAVVAGFLVFQSTRSGGEALALTLAFQEGDEVTYDTHMTMTGTAESDQFGTQPIDMDVTQTLGWKVTDVDAEGVATIETTTAEMSGTMNGLPMPSTEPAQAVTIQIAPDGRILTAGGMSFSSAGQTSGAAFPGMDQLTPLLPDHPVSPGDSWTKDFSQDFPFGEGKIEFTTQSTFDRYEEVDGTRAAVIVTNLTVPLDFTFDFSKLLAAFGDQTGGSGDLAGMGDASIEYGGQGSFTMTSWMDPEAKTMLKSSSSGDFDMTMEFVGVPMLEGPISFTGSFTQEVTRR